MADSNTIRALFDYIQDDLDQELVDNPKYKEITKRYDEKERLLKNSIGKDEFKIFEDFVDIYSELISFEAEENFVKGFSMANKLRDEALMK